MSALRKEQGHRELGTSYNRIYRVHALIKNPRGFDSCMNKDSFQRVQQTVFQSIFHILIRAFDFFRTELNFFSINAIFSESIDL